ncbi:DUF962-domain-containing protein [Sistotremastrum niveocremeum HHB9708]|uniref:DUF962-domain-containing protein n=2 Tax=Sistotremastraceae TaxID=3402574 RepID=A0A164ZUL6_9AGAM|nr:DUF962-domain-containing protein [Sistotremastrum niveocremeum HHB9708]KZT35537.1 DUF962-domain-containing protein [Sistotremastrum suecicum HHB10207 ss-3]
MKAFDVDHQLSFYGSYHNNKVNIIIHTICVPLILWSAFVFGSLIPTPWPANVLPTIQLTSNLVFQPNVPALVASIYQLYYFVLEPTAALLYVPQMIFMVLHATAFSHAANGIKIAAWIHFFSWIAQFIGHGVAERRAPALLDNILQAFVLAPFFVHLETLFTLGYNPGLHKRIQNNVGLEIAKFRKAEAEKKRAKTA